MPRLSWVTRKMARSQVSTEVFQGPFDLLLSLVSRQKVDVADYLKELRRGALLAGSGLQVISLAGQPEDFPYPVTFPDGRYLKYAVCVKSD